MAQTTDKTHNVFMENRKKTVMTGVTEIGEFDSQSINMICVLGSVTVRGEELKIGNFNSETGDLEIEGNIIALIYTDDSPTKDGFFKRIFK